MSEWKAFETHLKQPDLSGLIKIIDMSREVLNQLVNFLEKLLTFAGALDDPLVALLQKVITELRETLEGLLDDAGGYVLHVPVRKKLMSKFFGIGTGDVSLSWAGRLGIFGQETSPIGYNDPALTQFLVDANRYNGGNVGFFKTVVDSLYDEGDLSRPQFLSEEDYIGGLTLIMGTSADPLGFLDDIIQFGAMFGNSLGAKTMPKSPRPKNLKAYTTKGLQANNFDVMLTWDTMEVPVYTLPDLGGLILYPERYAIIRGKNTVEALSAKSVVDLVATRQLTQGLTCNGNSYEVIYEGPYTMTDVTYLDKDITAEYDDSFYYAVAWKLKAYNNNDVQDDEHGIDVDYWNISNVVRVVPYVSLPESTPPNWHRTSALADIFPAIAKLMRRLLTQVEMMESRVTGAAQFYQNYIDFLKREIYRYESILNDLLNDMEQLLQAFHMPNAGIYARTFHGLGGNDFFIADLAKSLLSTEEGSPPFHRGDEYVTGTIILAGGPEKVVKGLLKGLEFILGMDTTENEELSNMLNDLSTPLESLEDIQFNSSLQKGATPVKAPDFNPAMVLTECPTKSKTIKFTQFDPKMHIIKD